MSGVSPQGDASTSLFPASLSILRARLTLRLLADGPLPAYKGGMLRGGFGYAFQRVVCPPPCQGHASTCAVRHVCPYHQIFEPTHPAEHSHLHNLRDIPRAFVITSPTDQRVAYRAGDVLEGMLTLIGSAITALPHFISSFAELGKLGLGERRLPARLERMEALYPWQVTGVTVYGDDRVHESDQLLPLITSEAIRIHGTTLPATIRLTFTTPLRLQVKGAVLRSFDLPAMVRALCWRLHALSTFYGDGPWHVDHQALVEQARQIRVTQPRMRWMDWGRTSTRDPQRRDMKLGGLIGSVDLHDVPNTLRALLVAGSLVHVGKNCTFGHGHYRIEHLS